MENDLQMVQDLPIALDGHSITPFGDHFVVKNLRHRTFLFVDAEERTLLEAMNTPVSMAALIQLYHKDTGKYSYKKVVDLVVRLLNSSFLTPAAAERLLKHGMFKPFAPRPRRRPFLSRLEGGLGPLARLAAPVVRGFDGAVALVLMVLGVAYSVHFWMARAGPVDLFAVQGGRSPHLFALGVWILSLSAVWSLTHAFKYALLVSKGLEAIDPGVRMRYGIPCFHINDADILRLGRTPTLRFHLAALLFPGLAALSAVCAAGFIHPSASTGIWVLASLLILFLEASPLLKGELLTALDRLSGRRRLLETLKTFVHRKFVGRLFSFGTTFQFEAPLIGYGLLSVLWLYAAYGIVSIGVEGHLERLSDAAVLAESPAERLSAAVFIGGILFPFLALGLGVLRLLLVNLHGMIEKPLDRWMNSLNYVTARFRRPAPGAVEIFLREIPLFACLPEESRKKLAQYVQIEFFSAGRAVVWQGAPGDAFYVIYSGTAEVFHEEPDGRREVLAALSPKDSFGEIALIRDIPRTATVRALSPLVCLVLRKQLFKEFVETRADAAESVTNIIQWTALLKNMPIFTDLPADALARVILETAEREIPAGRTMLREGDAAEEFFILRAGAATVWKNHGKPFAQKIAGLKAGDYFGEIALFEDSPRTATVVADEPSRVLVMPKNAFFRILRINVFSGVWVEETVRTRRKELELSK